MKLEVLNKARSNTMRNKHKLRKETISTLIDNVNKATITPKGRIEVTDELVDAVILKEKKTVQEMIDTCPKERSELLKEYTDRLNVINEFAPKLVTDKDEIKRMILSSLPDASEIEINKSNKGIIMKHVMPAMKGKADMKIVNEVLGELLK